MAASEAFFSIVELVEHILSYCSEKDILLAQSVNQQWRRIIRHSPPLRRQLYLDQTNDRQTWAMTESIHRANGSSYEPQIYPRSQLTLERRALYLWRLRVLGKIDCKDECPRSELRLRTPAKLNPLLSTGVSSGKDLSLDERASKSPCVRLSLEPVAFEDERNSDKAGLRMQMFLSQPACTSVKCRLTMRRNLPTRSATTATTSATFVQHGFIDFDYRNEDGVRVHEVLQAARRQWRIAKGIGHFERYDLTIRMPAIVEMVDGDAEEVERRTVEWRKSQKQFGARVPAHRPSDLAWQHGNGDIVVHG